MYGGIPPQEEGDRIEGRVDADNGDEEHEQKPCCPPQNCG
jgi:hypothetical protein